jgi:HlyD family type I secretion membrane fusion protein
MNLRDKTSEFVQRWRRKLGRGDEITPGDLVREEAFETSADTRPVIKAGMTIILVTFVGFGGWAAFAPLSQGAVASGKIVVENQRKTVQHLDGGIVKKLLVHDGETVKKGQVLMELEDTRIDANVQIYQSQYFSAKAQEARLIAERDGKDDIDFPTELLERENDPEVAKIIQGQRDQFRARRETLRGGQNILAKQVTQLQQLVSGLESQTAAKAQQVELLNEEIKGLRELFARGNTSKQRLLALEREASEMEGERARSQADIASARLRIGETQLGMIQNDKDFRQKVVDELGKVQADLNDNQERLVAARDVLDHAQIKASTSGIIVGLSIHSVGAVIPPGRTIMEIVPQNLRLIVQARARAQDIANIHVGVPAEVRIIPFKQRLLPILMGRVIAVSADSLEDERTGIPYYQINVEISKEEMTKLNGQVLVPGMPADVIVQAGEYTALEYFLGPLTDSLARAFRG